MPVLSCIACQCSTLDVTSAKWRRCTSKGIDRKTLSLMCEILPSQLGGGRSYAFLSGPSFAREIAEGLATAVVVASEDRGAAFGFRDLLEFCTLLEQRI